MRYFFNVQMGTRKAKDPDGSEFASLDQARQEAEQTVRDLAVEELLQGRTLSEHWRVEIADAYGNVLETVVFEAAIFKQPRRKSRSVPPTEHYRRVLTTFEETRSLATIIAETCDALRTGLANI